MCSSDLTNMGVATTTMAITIIVETEVTQEDTEAVVTIMGIVVMVTTMVVLGTIMETDRIAMRTRGISVKLHALNARNRGTTPVNAQRRKLRKPPNPILFRRDM